MPLNLEEGASTEEEKSEIRNKNKTINDSFDLCEIFLNEAYVATIPGDGFGAPGYVRFSYAVDKKTIKNGIDRIEKIIFEIK